MKINLRDALGMTAVALVGIVSFAYGLYKGGEALQTFGLIGGVFSLIFPLVSIWFWCDYFNERRK